jgi:hypothetical protein
VVDEVEDEYEVDLDELRAEAEAAGVKVDGRWGAERLREEIDAAKAEPDEIDETEGPTGDVPELDELDRPTAVVYGAESEQLEGDDAVKVVEDAEASRVAASEAQDAGREADPPLRVAATEVSNIQTPTGMVQRVEKLAQEEPKTGGYTTHTVTEGAEG